MVRSDFITLAENEIYKGFSRGIDLFTESITTEIERDQLLREHSMSEIVECLVDDYVARKQQR